MSVVKSFIKKTRKGHVIRVTREHYLRDDLSCGSECCSVCQQLFVPRPLPLTKEAKEYLVLDTNVVLHQMDLLEHPASMNHVICLQTVLEETRHRDLSMYARIRNIISDDSRHFYVFCNEHHRETNAPRANGETPNDRNDRAIREAALWYAKHLKSSHVTIKLLSNDAQHLAKAAELGLTAMTVGEYIKSRPEYQQLSDLLSFSNIELNEGEGSKGLYVEHRSMSEVMAGLKSKRYHQTVIRCTPYSCFKAFVTSQSVDHDVMICGAANINRAVDGDVVVFEELPETQWQSEATAESDTADSALAVAPPASNERKTPSGRVVGIIKRNWKSYCGHLDMTSQRGESFLFVPMDKKVPKIRIRTHQGPMLANKRLIVTIDNWPKTSLYPIGHFVRIIGDIGDREAESEAILLENDVVLRPFTQAVLNYLPSRDWKISQHDYDTRLDLRSVRICSIDPPGCTDIDDALHCRLLENGNFEVGVHIADVSHFVKTGTPLDVEAAERATTVYLVDKRIDMLPKILGEFLCSLHQHVERLAFSVLWELTPEAETVKVTYHKTIIQSVCSFTYAQAQMRIDDQSLTDDLTQDLRNLNKLAKHLKARRKEAGALNLASADVRFNLDSETHDPIDVGVYEMKETNSLVEEFMLLANIAVARRIHQTFPETAMLRRHQPPPPKKFESLLKVCDLIGVDLDTSSSKALNDSLDKHVKPDEPFFNQLLRILATRSMQEAQYFASGQFSEAEFGHYGLASPIYTHFTSPIRRYPDIIVHRMLAHCIGWEGCHRDMQDSEIVSAIADNSNIRHRNADLASRASVNLHTVLFFRKQQAAKVAAHLQSGTDVVRKPPREYGQVEPAIVTRVTARYASVLIPRYGIEGSINVVDKRGKPLHGYSYDENRHALVSNTAPSLSVFQRVEVLIFVDDECLTDYTVRIELSDAFMGTQPEATAEVEEVQGGKKRKGSEANVRGKKSKTRR
eukprot:c18439_g1_i1.p1 GENE.c18439_g1_i1~~c18439_g1_i1.p1  ORF type:complete len:968 (+),score=237.71 c18439_g1_i1:29-2932(+)